MKEFHFEDVLSYWTVCFNDDVPVVYDGEEEYYEVRE